MTTAIAPPQPCEQRPGEDDAAYALFDRYMALGPGRRSLERLARATGHPEQHITDLSARWDWRERAEACDESERLEQLAAERAIRSEARRRVQALPEDADAGELAKLHRLLTATQQSQPRRARPHQDRDGGGRWTSTTPATMRPHHPHQPERECARAECRAPLAASRAGGLCRDCERAGHQP